MIITDKKSEYNKTKNYIARKEIKAMKKFLAIILAVVMTCTLVFAVSAADSDNAAAQSGTQNVNVTVNNETDTVYNVDIQWTGLSFIYDYNKGTWNSQTHEYADAAEGWQNDEETITVINHSNAPVYLAAEYVPDGVTGVTVEVNVANGSLPTAEGVDPSDVSSLTATVTVTVGGAPADKAFSGKVGAVTITIDDAPIFS